MVNVDLISSPELVLLFCFLGFSLFSATQAEKTVAGVLIPAHADINQPQLLNGGVPPTVVSIPH